MIPLYAADCYASPDALVVLAVAVAAVAVVAVVVVAAVVHVGRQ